MRRTPAMPSHPMPSHPMPSHPMPLAPLPGLGGEDPREAAIRRRITRYAVAALALFALALWLLVPYLAQAHRRLEPWKIPLLWTGDAVGILWALRFFATHYVAGVPFIPEPTQREVPPARRGGWIPVLATVLFSLLTQLGFTFYLMDDERRAYTVAAVTVGHAETVRHYDFEKATNYLLAFRFTDASGRLHEDRLLLHEDRRDGFPPGMPADTAARLRGLRQRFDFPLRYDPTWPGRTWIDGCPPVDDNHLAWFLLLVQLFQTLTLILALVIYLSRRAAAGPQVWWGDLHHVLPFLAEIPALLFIGILLRAVPGGVMG